MRALVLMVFLTACGRGLTAREGYVQVEGGRVWYRIVGSGTRTPLLVLHGGPGVPSTYLKPLAAIADERPVIFYDQLGSGKSDHPADTTLWRMDRYLAELDAVREALGLRRVHLYGHSFGTVIAIEYVLAHPTGVRSLILGGAVADAQRFKRDNDSLIATLAESTVTAFRAGPGKGPAPSPRFVAAYVDYLRHFFARRQPWSSDLDSAIAGVDHTSERGIDGYMQRYNSTARLGGIAVPTLFLVGRYDNTTPATVRTYQQRIAGAELVVFDSSGHLPMQDEPERYIAVMRDFLHRADRRPGL